MEIRSAAKAASGPQMRPEARLRGNPLVIAKVIWIAVALLELLLLLLNILAPTFGSKTVICPFSSTCGYASTTLQALEHAHIPAAAFSTYLIVLGLTDALITVGLGVLIYWKKFDRLSGWLASLVLLLLGTGLISGDDSSMTLLLQGIVSIALTFCTLVVLGFFIVTFPDGRLVPRWSWLAGSTLLIQGLLYQLPGDWNLDNWPAPLFLIEAILAFGSPVAIQIYRYTRVSTPAQRRQTKWVVFSLVCLVLLLLLPELAAALFPSLNAPDSLFPLVSASLLPSLALVLIYVGLVFGGQALLTGLFGSNDAPVVVFSTLVVAFLFQPLRRLLQKSIDRRFYRTRYDAARILHTFSATLPQAVELERLREQLVSVVQETMQPTQVSLWLNDQRRQRSVFEESAAEDEE